MAFEGARRPKLQYDMVDVHRYFQQALFTGTDLAKLTIMVTALDEAGKVKSVRLFDDSVQVGLYVTTGDLMGARRITKGEAADIIAWLGRE